jgi:hypothetical protein
MRRSGGSLPTTVQTAAPAQICQSPTLLRLSRAAGSPRVWGSQTGRAVWQAAVQARPGQQSAATAPGW